MKSNSRENGVSREQFPILSELFSIDSPDMSDYIDNTRKLVNSSEIETLLLQMLKDAIEKANTSGHMFQNLNCPVVLWRDEHKLISFSPSEIGPSLGCTRVNDHLIASSTTQQVIGFIGQGSETLHHYTFDCQDLNVFTPGVQMKLQKKIKIKGGDTFQYQAGAHVYNFDKSHNVLGSISISPNKSESSLMWLFNRETNIAEGCSSASSLATRLQYAIKLFLRFPTQESIPILSNLALENEFHFVRWDAIKALLQLDFNEGYRLLQRASKNEHIHLMNAANRTLINLQKNGFVKAS